MLVLELLWLSDLGHFSDYSYPKQQNLTTRSLETQLSFRAIQISNTFLTTPRDVISPSPSAPHLGGGFKYLFFHPYLGKMNPFWRAYFSDGLAKNHQPVIITFWLGLPSYQILLNPFPFIKNLAVFIRFHTLSPWVCLKCWNQTHSANGWKTFIQLSWSIPIGIQSAHRTWEWFHVFHGT